MGDPLTSDIGAVDLAEYLRRLRWRWWAVVLVVMLGIAGGLVLTNVSDEEYVSETSILVFPTDAGTSAGVAGGRTSGGINLDTEAQIIRSASMAEAVSADLDDAIAPDQLIAGIAVTVPPNSEVLRLTFAAGSAELAQVGARGYADAYLADRAAGVRAQIEREAANLEAQRDERHEQLDAVTDRIAELPAGSRDLPLAETEHEVLLREISSIDVQLSALDQASAPVGRVISQASLPQAPAAPNATLNMAGGMLLGLVLGVAAAVAIDHLDRRIRRPADIGRARFGLIGAVGGRQHDVVSMDLGADDDIDRVRNRLLTYAGNARVIHVVPASRRHSCGLVGAGIAASYAREHGRALYVVATPDGAVTGLLGGGDSGLTDVLDGPRSTGDVVVWSYDMPRVSILGPGRNPHRLGQLLQPGPTGALLEEAKATYPVVVVETGAVSSSAGAQAVARAADVVVIVAERNIADTRSLQKTGDDLSNLHARLAGVVLAPRVRITVGAGSVRRTADGSGQARPDERDSRSVFASARDEPAVLS